MQFAVAKYKIHLLLNKKIKLQLSFLERLQFFDLIVVRDYCVVACCFVVGYLMLQKFN